jgi:hypothetical protein
LGAFAEVTRPVVAIEAWPTLPTAIRAGILATVKAASGRRGED